jgi:FMN reductase (NADPH)
MNETQRLMSKHCTIRAFRADPVPRETIEKCVRAARQAASSSNVQAYCLLQVTDRSQRAKLRELTGDQAQVEDAGAFFAVCADEHRHALIAADSGQENARNFESFLVAVIDATLFVQNLVLAFESEGYGTCYIGGLRNELSEVDRMLELPEGVYPLFGLCVGVPDETPSKRPRLDPQALWFEGRYPTDEETRDWIAEHDDRAARYYADRGAPGRTWTGGLLRKITRRLRESVLPYYRSKGAGLQ